MSVKGDHYYIGAGVFHFGGVDYGYGKKLPTEVPAATIEAMKAKGKVSDTAPAKVGEREMGTLRDKVQELTVALDASKKEASEAIEAAMIAGEEIERLRVLLNDVTNEREAARNTVNELNKTIEDLTTQLMTPPAPPAPPAPLSDKAAGPAGKGKQK